MKTVKMSPENLKKLSVEVTESGFILWINDTEKIKHWILDGSMVFGTGIIHIADNPDSESSYSVSIIPAHERQLMGQLFTDLRLDQSIDD